MWDSGIRLKPAKQAYGIREIGSSTHHCVHQTSDCTRIWHASHFSLVTGVFGQSLRLRPWFLMTDISMVLALLMLKRSRSFLTYVSCESPRVRLERSRRILTPNT